MNLVTPSWSARAATQRSRSPVPAAYPGERAARRDGDRGVLRPRRDPRNPAIRLRGRQPEPRIVAENDVETHATEPLGSEIHVIFPSTRRPSSTRTSPTLPRRGRKTISASAFEGKSLWTARVNAGSSVRAGDRIELAVDTSNMHFFDPTAGSRSVTSNRSIWPEMIAVPSPPPRFAFLAERLMVIHLTICIYTASNIA